MRRRTLSLILCTACFYVLPSNAQLKISSGEINLRGEILIDKKNNRFVVNAGSRAMKTLQLTKLSSPEILKNYQSGTKVEVCVQVQEQAKDLKAELLKIRPLGPDEAVLVYTGQLKGCPRTKGCREFGKKIESSVLSSSLEAANMGGDYFSCEK